MLKDADGNCYDKTGKPIDKVDEVEGALLHTRSFGEERLASKPPPSLIESRATKFDYVQKHAEMLISRSFVSVTAVGSSIFSA